MNTVLFVLANLAIGMVIVWSVQNDRRKVDETDGVFAIRRTKAKIAKAAGVRRDPTGGRAPPPPPRRRR
jgi:hypothetical protein